MRSVVEDFPSAGTPQRTTLFPQTENPHPVEFCRTLVWVTFERHAPAFGATDKMAKHAILSANQIKKSS